MKLVGGLTRIAGHLVSGAAARSSPTRWKQFNELRYWKQRRRLEGPLSNTHYAYFYTKHFGLDESFYVDKVILDIGCGPRGSLEWASMASRRIGLDPLAREYLRLGADQHQMEYVSCPSESIPMEDGECDAVFSFNSLDHVQDVDQTIREIKRVTGFGGLFLLLVEVNHPPTACEPHSLTPESVTAAMEPEFSCKQLQVYKADTKGMYDSIRIDERLPSPEHTREMGYLSALFVRGESC